MSREPSPKALEVVAKAATFLGSTQFQRRIRPVRSRDALLGWKLMDVANGGDDSCAAFISHVLVKTGLLSRTRSTVHTLLDAVEQRGWEPTTEQVVGGIALWGFREDVTPAAGQIYGHVGFYVGNDTCISHSSIEFVPVQHPPILSDGRLPLAHYAHESLTQPGEQN